IPPGRARTVGVGPAGARRDREPGSGSISIDVGRVAEKSVEAVLQVVVGSVAVLRANPDAIVAGAETEVLEGVPVDRCPAIADPALDAADRDVEVLPAQAKEERLDDLEVH